MENLHFNYRLFINELERRGIVCRLIPSTEIIECRYQDHKEYILETCNRLIPSHYVPILNDKIYTKFILADAGLPIAPFILLTNEDVSESIEKIEKFIDYPICIKPPHLSHGYFVHPHIENRETLRFILEKSLIPQKFPALIVEKHIYGDDIRFFLMQREEPIILKRSPPKVTGNGKDTLRTLIELENYRRFSPRTTCLCEIYLNDIDGVRCLEQQGLSLESIIEEGKNVSLLFLSNVTYGGTCEVLTEPIHADYIAISNKIFSLFPGLPYVAIDFLIENYREAYISGKAVVSEMGTYPGFSLFLMPSNGPSVNIVARIVDRLFPETMNLND